MPPGADGVTIEMFEKDLKDNLYKVWNRMCSGTYFPPPVRAVEIPKSPGGTRVLGVPSGRIPTSRRARSWTPRSAMCPSVPSGHRRQARRR